MVLWYTPGDDVNGLGSLRVGVRFMVSRGIWFGDKPAERNGQPCGGGTGEKTIVVGHTQKCNLEKPLMSNARAATHKYHFIQRVVLRGKGHHGVARSFFGTLEIKKMPKYELRVFIKRYSRISGRKNGQLTELQQSGGVINTWTRGPFVK